MAFWNRRKEKTAPSEKDRYDKYRALGVKIGKRCHIYQPRFDPMAPFLIEIGDNVGMAAGVTVLTHDGALAMVHGVERFGRVRIGNDVMVGTDALLLPGVTIGDGAVVGAKAVVSRDVPPREVWGGNPARRICTVDELLAKSKARPESRVLTVSRDFDPEDKGYRAHRDTWAAHLRKLHTDGYFDAANDGKV